MPDPSSSARHAAASTADPMAVPPSAMSTSTCGHSPPCALPSCPANGSTDMGDNGGLHAEGGLLPELLAQGLQSPTQAAETRGRRGLAGAAGVPGGPPRRGVEPMMWER
jgi:hypothetical protein